MKMLIAAGIDVNQVNYHDETPLMCSNPSGNAAITKALIEAGADPNIGSTEEEETALMIHILTLIRILPLCMSLTGSRS